MIQQFYFWICTKKKKMKTGMQTRYLYTNGHSFVIHSDKKIETTQMSTEVYEQINKIWCVYIFFSPALQGLGLLIFFSPALQRLGSSGLIPSLGTSTKKKGREF